MPSEPSANPSRPAVAAQEPYTKAQLTAMLADVESDLVERKETFDGETPNTVRQAICAFANDLPNHRRAGVIFVGARDDGTPTGLDVHDALLLKLAHCKTDGNILPLPTMTVHKHTFDGSDMAVVTVLLSQARSRWQWDARCYIDAMRNNPPPAEIGIHRDALPHFAGRKAEVSDLRKRLGRWLFGISPEGIDSAIVNFPVSVATKVPR